jgi:hypothetical protein
MSREQSEDQIDQLIRALGRIESHINKLLWIAERPRRRACDDRKYRAELFRLAELDRQSKREEANG